VLPLSLEYSQKEDLNGNDTKTPEDQRRGKIKGTATRIEGIRHEGNR
jgi:hypothetical protein